MITKYGNFIKSSNLWENSLLFSLTLYMKSVRTSTSFLKNMVSSIQGLAPITNPLNSVLVEKKLINVGIIVEVFLFVGVFIWVRELNNKQSRQPSLSKKTIKKLKF